MIKVILLCLFVGILIAIILLLVVKVIKLRRIINKRINGKELTLGDHLRNLLTPYKYLLEALNSDDPKVLDFIKGRSDFKEGLDRLIEFSKSDIMEKINYEKIRKE